MVEVPVAPVIVHQTHKISGQLIIQEVPLTVKVGIRILEMWVQVLLLVPFFLEQITVLLVILILQHYHKQVLQVQEQSTEVTH